MTYTLSLLLLLTQVESPPTDPGEQAIAPVITIKNEATGKGIPGVEIFKETRQAREKLGETDSNGQWPISKKFATANLLLVKSGFDSGRERNISDSISHTFVLKPVPPEFSSTRGCWQLVPFVTCVTRTYYDECGCLRTACCPETKCRWVCVPMCGAPIQHSPVQVSSHTPRQVASQPTMSSFGRSKLATRTGSR